jgi:rod shape-determining protein MreC
LSGRETFLPLAATRFELETNAMDNLLTRYLNLIVLAGVLAAQIIGLGVQIKREDGMHSTRLVRIWTVSLITPFERIIVRSQTGVHDIWRNYLNLRGVRQENRELKGEIERLRLEQVRMTQDADQGRRLQALLAFREKFVSATLPAQVIGWSGSEQSRAVYIDKGERDGMTRDLAVITAEGVVGKILEVYPGTSLVLLINDQTSGVGAILEQSRVQGVVRGSATGETIMERIMSDQAVPLGERVLASGGDGIYSKGLPIGTVDKVFKKPSEIFWTIRVRPAAGLNRLEEVLVVTQKQETEATAAEMTKSVRAADVLSSRLPGVPEKPKEGAVAAPAAGAAVGGTAADKNSKKPAAKPNTTGATATAPAGTKPAQPVTIPKPVEPATAPTAKPSEAPQ